MAEANGTGSGGQQQVPVKTTGPLFMQLPTVEPLQPIAPMPANVNRSVGLGYVPFHQQPTVLDVHQLLIATREDVNLHGYGLKTLVEAVDERLKSVDQQFVALASTMEKLCADVQEMARNPQVPNLPVQVEPEASAHNRTMADIPFVTIEDPETKSSYTMFISKATHDDFLTSLKPRQLVQKMLRTIHKIPDLQQFTLKLRPPTNKKKTTDQISVTPVLPMVLLPLRTMLLVTAGVMEVFPCTAKAVKNNPDLYKRWKKRKEKKIRGYVSKVLSYFRTKYDADGFIISNSTKDSTSDPKAAAAKNRRQRKKSGAVKSKEATAEEQTAEGKTAEGKTTEEVAAAEDDEEDSSDIFSSEDDFYDDESDD